MDITDITRHCPLAVDRYGSPVDIVEGQTGYLVRRVSGGRPGVVNHLDEPLIIRLHMSRQDVIERLEKPGIHRLYPVDEFGDEIPGAPIAVLEITAEELGLATEGPQWMRLDRVFEVVERTITAMESKDVIFGQVAKSLLEANTELQAGAVRLLDTANNTILVASGMERPELDIDGIADRMVRLVQSSEPKQPSRDPWFVQLLNGEWGQRMVDLVNGLGNRRKSSGTDR